MAVQIVGIKIKISDDGTAKIIQETGRKGKVAGEDIEKQKTYGSVPVIDNDGKKRIGNPDGRFPSNLLVSDDVLNDSKTHSNFSRSFSLDAWTEQKLPFLIVPKASTNEKKAETINNNHITVKPVRLMSYLITMNSRPGDIVLDPFVGSGTTCIAAKLLGRKYIGIEKKEEYHKIAVNRIEHASTDNPVFAC